MADRSERLAIIVTAQDLASGKLGKVRGELASMGIAGKLSAVGLGAGIAAVQKGENAFRHFAGRVSSLAGPLGLVGLTTAGFGLAGAFERGISKATDWGLAIEKLGGLTSNTTEQLSGLLGITEKYGISNERIAQIVGFTEKTLGKLEVAHAKGGKAAKSDALQHLELVKAQRVANGESTKTINKLIAEQKARDELNASLSNAVDGTTKLAALETTYGVKLTDNTGKVLDFQSVLLNVADAYSKATSAADKAKVAALSASVFGRGYADLIPILKLGRKGILDAEEAAKELGLTLSKDNVADLAKYREAAREAGDATSGLELQLGLLVMPDLTDVLKTFVGYMKTHRAEVQQFFRDGLKVAEGLAAFVTGTLIPAIQTVAGAVKGVWSAIPKPLQDMLTTGLVADRTVKFLFGFSPAHMVLDGLETGISKGLGGILGQFFGKGIVQPVFVTNQVGGLPGAAPAAGAGASALAAVAAPVIAVAAVAGVAAWQNSQISDQSDALRAQTAAYAKIASDKDLASSIDGVRKDLDAMQGLGANAYGQKGTTTDVLNMLIAEQNRRFTAGNTPVNGSDRQEAIFGATEAQTVAAEMNARRIEAAENRTGAIVGASGAVIGHQLDALHQSFKTDLGQLIHATKPVDVAAAARKVAAEITKGVGNLATTNHVLATLRAQLSHTHDPATAAVLRAAIAAVEKKIPGREYATAELHKADEVVRSNRSTKEKVAELKTIEQQLKDHGLPNAASRINARINAVKSSVDLLPGRIKNALGGYLYGGTSSGKTGKDDVYHPASKPSGGSSKPSGGSSSSSSDGRSSGTTYDIGSWSVPHTGPAIVHEREMILRPGDADRVRASLARPGLMSAGAARAVMVNLSVHLTAVMTPKVTFSTRSLQERQKADLRYGKVSAG